MVPCWQLRMTTEASLAQMRECEQPVHDLVGTPKGRLAKPWAQVREQVDVRRLEQDGEVYILARSLGRMHKERAMRRRRLERLCQRLRELQRPEPGGDELLMKLGDAKRPVFVAPCCRL